MFERMLEREEILVSLTRLGEVPWAWPDTTRRGALALPPDTTRRGLAGHRLDTLPAARLWLTTMLQYLNVISTIML